MYKILHSPLSIFPISPLESGCKSDSDCSLDTACIRGVCTNPCSLRASCGTNAICTVVLHKPRCECPECFTGRAHVRCKPKPGCRGPPTVPQISGKECGGNEDCSPSYVCEYGTCIDPCTRNHQYCEEAEKCVVQNHEIKCVCKEKLVINVVGELTCPGKDINTCISNDDCPSELACIGGSCQNPCHVSLCPEGKTCQVLNHEALCMCTEGCNPSVSICLKDKGCLPSQACVSFQCVDPCASITCEQNAPCIVENHKAICKFCPENFVADQNYGCLPTGTTSKKSKTVED